MTRNEAIQIANKLFKSHSVDEFHITADGQGFFTAQSADNHATSLNDKKVHKVLRSDKPEQEEGEGGGSGASQEPKANPYEGWTNDQMKEELTKREVEIPKNANKAALLALLEGSEPKA